MEDHSEQLAVLPVSGGWVTITTPARVSECSDDLWKEALAATENGRPLVGQGVHIPVSGTAECEVRVERDGDVIRRVIIEL